MIRNIIFDWSGTLVDDLPAVLAATNFVFEKCGVPPLSMEPLSGGVLPAVPGFLRALPAASPDGGVEWDFHGHFSRAPQAAEEVAHAREFLVFCREHRIRSFVLSTIRPDYYAAQAGVTGFDQFMERTYLEVRDKRTRSPRSSRTTGWPRRKRSSLATCNTTWIQPATAGFFRARC